MIGIFDGAVNQNGNGVGFLHAILKLSKRSPYSHSCQVSVLSGLSLAFIPSSLEYEGIAMKSKEKESISLFIISPLWGTR